MKPTSRKKTYTIGLATIVALFFVAGTTLIAHGYTPANVVTPGTLDTINQQQGLTNTAAAYQAPQGQKDLSSPYSCSVLSGSFVTCMVFFAAYLIYYVAGLIISFIALAIQWAMQFNMNVLGSPMVQIGFSLALSIANLCFVLGIIVIAIATILRSQTYGIKQILWKLVVMAILVNFGLVIAGPIMGLSQTFSSYFLRGMGINTDTSQASGRLSEASNFATLMAGSMNPQAMMSAPSPSAAKDYGTGAGPGGTSFMKAVGTLIFSFVVSAIMIIALAALAVLLLVRYIYIGILLILLPFAWLSWVFPRFGSHWESWWNQFIKWTFFPAAALFFIYLASQTAGYASTASNGANSYMDSVGITGNGQNSQDVNSQNAVAVTQQGDLAMRPTLSAQELTNETPSTLYAVADSILFCALLIGGLFAAASLTGKAGQVAVSSAKTASKWVGSKAGQVGRKAGRAALRGSGVQDLTEKMRSSSTLAKIPIVGRIGSLAGRAVQPYLDNRDMYEKAKKNTPKDTGVLKQNLRGSMSFEDKLSHLSQLRENGDLDDSVMVHDGRRGLVKATDFLDAHGDDKSGDFKNYGWGQEYRDANKALGSNKEMRDAQRNVVRLSAEGAAPNAVEGARAVLDSKTDDFVRNLKKGDMSKLNPDGLFAEVKDNPEENARRQVLAKSLMRSFAINSPQLVPDLMSRMNGSVLKKFGDDYKATIENELSKGDVGVLHGKIADVERKEGEIKDKTSNITKLEGQREILRKKIDDLARQKQSIVGDPLKEKPFEEQITAIMESDLPRVGAEIDALNKEREALEADKKILNAAVTEIDKNKPIARALRENLTKAQNSLNQSMAYSAIFSGAPPGTPPATPTP